MYDMQGRIILSMYDVVLFENFRTRKREAGIFRNLNFGDYFLKTCVFSARKHRLLGRWAKTGRDISRRMNWFLHRVQFGINAA